MSDVARTASATGNALVHAIKEIKNGNRKEEHGGFQHSGKRHSRHSTNICRLCRPTMYSRQNVFVALRLGL